MNVNRVLGSAVLSLIAVFGTTSAQADEYYWTGTGANDSWTTVGNWVVGGLPVSAYPAEKDTAFFTNAENVVRLEQDLIVEDESTAKYTKIYNDDPLTTNKLTFTGLYKLNEGDSTFEANGNVVIEMTGGNGYVKGTTKATDGAKITLALADFSDNPNQKFIAIGADSSITISAVSYPTWSGSNTGVSFEAYDGGVVTFVPAKVGTSYRYPRDAVTLIARNASLYANNSNTKFLKGVYVTCDNSYMDLQTLQAGEKGSYITLANGGTLRLRGATKYPNGNYASTLTLGDGCVLQQNDGSLSLNQGLTIKLAPTPVSRETTGLVETRNTSGTGNKASITLNSGVKFEIDCSAFANFYGKKTVIVINQARSDSTATYNLPSAANVTLKGEGAENCTATFAKDSTGKKLMLTVVSRNIPEGTVALIEDKAAFGSIAEAFEAAEEDDVVTLISDAVLTEALPVNKAVSLDLAEYTVTGDGVDGALFNVEGGALTIGGTTGVIDGGSAPAVAVTGGAFTVPVSSTATFTSTGDALVVNSGETRPTVLILGGNFASTGDGKPVVSSATEGEPLGGFLQGGTYNKEPDAALVADGYVAEQVDGKWTVVLDGEPICKIGDRVFSSLERAYAAANDYDDIFLIADATVPMTTLARNITVWIELCGYTLTPEESEDAIFTIEAGTVYVYNNQGDGKGGLKGGIVVTAGTLGMNNTITIDADPAVTVNGGTANVSGCMLNGGVVLNGGTLNLNATVDAPGVAIAANGGTLNVTGGSYTGVTSAFVAGAGFNSKGIDDGSFSSEIASKYLKTNRKMEQQGDRWVAVLASDEKAVTYTWKNDASGFWTNKENWTANIARYFGYPNSLNYATVVFPAAMASNNVVTLDTSVSVVKVNVQNTKPMKLVVDNAKLTIKAGTTSAKAPLEFGKTGPVNVEFKGAAPQIEAKSYGDKGYVKIGESYDAQISFDLPSKPWTSTTAPIYVSGGDAPVMFYGNARVRVDAAAAAVPAPGTSVTNVLAYNADGIRYYGDDGLEAFLKRAEIVNCPTGTKGELVYADQGLSCVLTWKKGLMLLIK